MPRKDRMQLHANKIYHNTNKHFQKQQERWSRTAAQAARAPTAEVALFPEAHFRPVAPRELNLIAKGNPNNFVTVAFMLLLLMTQRTFANEHFPSDLNKDLQLDEPTGFKSNDMKSKLKAMTADHRQPHTTRSIFANSIEMVNADHSNSSLSIG